MYACIATALVGSATAANSACTCLVNLDTLTAGQEFRTAGAKDAKLPFPKTRLAPNVRNPRASGRRNVTSFHEGAVIDFHDPRGALVVTTFPRPRYLPVDELLDQLPHDVAVSAKHRALQLGVAHQLHRARQPFAFAERRRLFERELERLGEWLHCLHAAKIRAGGERGVPGRHACVKR